jgi:chromosome partitioning protein
MWGLVIDNLYRKDFTAFIVFTVFTFVPQCKHGTHCHLWMVWLNFTYWIEMIVLIANEKGGVGKTTISVNLAAMCQLAGKEVLLVDTDKQESASTWSAMRYENDVWPKITCVSKTGKVGFDLIDLGKKYDVVIVDAGGRDSLEMRQAIAVCGICIIPVKPAQFDVWSLSRMASLIRDVSERVERNINAFAFINGASPHPGVRETTEVKEALKDYADVFPALESVITERIAFRKASRDGQGVMELLSSQADSKANLEMMALYKEVFNEKWTAQ